VRAADKLITVMYRLSRNLRASTSWNPQGLSRPVMGLLVYSSKKYERPRIFTLLFWREFLDRKFPRKWPGHVTPLDVLFCVHIFATVYLLPLPYHCCWYLPRCNELQHGYDGRWATLGLSEYLRNLVSANSNILAKRSTKIRLIFFPLPLASMFHALYLYLILQYIYIYMYTPR